MTVWKKNCQPWVQESAAWKAVKTAFAIFLLWHLGSFPGNACPCGCGALNPLAVEHGESAKVRVLAERTYHLGVVKSNGQLGTEDGPQVTDTLTVSGAVTLFEDASFFVSAPVQTHRHTDGQDTALGDPSLGLRYSPVRFWYGPIPYTPDIALSLAHKRSTTRGSPTPGDRPHGLSLHGNGFDESSFGFEAIWTSWPWNASLGEQITWFHPKHLPTGGEEEPSILYRPGLSQQTSLAIAHTWLGYGQISLSVAQERKREDLWDGASVTDSDRLQQSITVTGSGRAGERATLSVGWKETGLVGLHKNTPRNHTVQTSWVQAF